MVDTGVFFGARRVSPAEKTARVRALFDSVSGRYDLMNDVMSLGLHRLWKARAVTMLRPRPGQLLLDVAGGTGDMADAFVRRADALGSGDGQATRAVVCDFSQAMLAQAAASDDKVCCDAVRLPFADSCADAVCIAFGLRNIAQMSVALSEFARVLRPGGRFVCLELAQPEAFSVRRVYDSASRIIPLLGRWIASDEDAYHYLVDSIRSFPDRQTVADMMRSAGLVEVHHHDMACGIVTAYQARGQ